jgi:L-rhamnose isomerase/sugar isomerase
MLDQSHNVTDPVESLIRSANEIRRAYAQALLVDRARLDAYQQDNDALAASDVLKAGFRLDVDPILAEARYRSGGAIDPIATYRASGYRRKVADQRPAQAKASSGIV